MRGKDDKQTSMLMLLNPEDRIPKHHPIRKIKPVVDRLLQEMAPVFEEMYSHTGRPSIPPERLLKASLLMSLFTVRSERAFCEQLEYNLLFRWFLDMDMTEHAFAPTVFTKNRKRILDNLVAEQFFGAVVERARKRDLMSKDHFTVDGTLIQAWASMKSFRPKGEKPPDDPDDPGNPTVDFKKEKRTNQTHQSTTDPESKLFRKGKGHQAKLCFSGHALMENRNGLLADIRIGPAGNKIERDAALEMLDGIEGDRHITVGADKNYDTEEFVNDCRAKNITPHVCRNTERPGGSAIDMRTARHQSYAVSIRKRKLIEEIFGWMKTVGGFSRTRYKGIEKTQLWAYLVGAAYNLLRMARIEMAAA